MQVDGVMDLSDPSLERCRNNAEKSASSQNQTNLIEFYRNWSQIYEEDFSPENYVGPKLVADAVAEIFASETRATLNVLDVAAGTGLVGQELSKLGFQNIDALDACEDMLQKLRSKKIYNNTFQDIFSDKPIGIADNSYDVITLSGGFVPGHLPVNAVQEMIRVCKPGGYIGFVMRYAYLESPEYQGLEPLLRHLQGQHVWTMVKRTITPNYFMDNDGITFLYRKQLV